MAFLSNKTLQYAYFARHLNDHDWRGKDILDFGGNRGNILRDPDSSIETTRYWCLDVDREALQNGRATFPEANWVFYDRYCFFSNPRGSRGLPVPDFKQQFDYILAYSVFPNTTRSDMLDLVGQLRRLLKPEGALAFTFIDPHYHSWPRSYSGDNLRWRLERDNRHRPEVDIDGLHARARGTRWCILVNGCELYVETDGTAEVPVEQQVSHDTFYSAAYMRMLFPDALLSPPVNGEMQHCSILRR